MIVSCSNLGVYRLSVNNYFIFAKFIHGSHNWNKEDLIVINPIQQSTEVYKIRIWLMFCMNNVAVLCAFVHFTKFSILKDNFYLTIKQIKFNLEV